MSVSGYTRSFLEFSSPSLSLDPLHDLFPGLPRSDEEIHLREQVQRASVFRRRLQADSLHVPVQRILPAIGRRRRRTYQAQRLT